MTPGRGRQAPAPLPDDAHEWLSFADPDEDRTWLFDVTFLESPWTCIFGRGCQGVLTGPAADANQGCCSYGAHFTDEEDARRVEAAAATLTEAQWQHRRIGRDGRPAVLRRAADGQLVTRLVDDACIFLNRPGFGGGPGCALHLAAVQRGIPPLDLKPDVCWQLPLRREDLQATDGGHVTSVIRQWDRRDWGEGGAEFHWWCTEAPEAFVGAEPVYRTLRDELVALVGADVYDQLVALLAARRPPSGRRARSGTQPAPVDGPARVVALPHPARRR